MSTYQHEQYYVHVKTKGASKGMLERIRVLLVENDWDDHEFAFEEIVVDGFESESEANRCNEMIHGYLLSESF